MRILFVGENLADYLAKCHEALRTGLRQAYPVQFFGKGYAGYREDIGDYAEILKYTCAENRPDVLLTDFNLSPNPQEWSFPFAGLEKVDGLKAIVLGDYWNVSEGARAEFLTFLEEYDIRMVLCYFPGAVRAFSGTRLAERFFLLLPCFDPQIFNDWGVQKQYDVGFLAAGTTEYSDFYPERYAIHQKLRSRTDIRYLWAAHPGWQRRSEAHPLVGEGFSRAINSCRLFVTTAGKYAHPNPKYMEIMASRAVLLAETPDGADLVGLQDGVNYVSVTPDNVLEKVDEYLGRPQRCEEIARAGFALAMQRHSAYVRALEFGRIAQTVLERAAAPKSLSVPAAAGKRKAAAVQGGQRADVGLPLELINDRNAAQDILLPSSMPALPISSSPQYTLYRLVRYLKPKHILEIGSQHGASAVAMALAMRDNNTPVDITCIDPFLPSGDNDGLPTLENWYRNVTTSGFMGGIRLLMTTSEKVLPFMKEQYDFVLIDGSHEYKDVRYDFETVLALVPAGGYVWLHDYMTYESVRRACQEVVVKYNLPYAINEVQRNYRNDLCGWMIVRNGLPEMEERAAGEKRVLVLYDPHMGHATMQARGLALRETMQGRGWRVAYLNVRQATEEQIVAQAVEYGVVYLLKVAALSLVRELKNAGVRVVFDLADSLWKEHHRGAGWQDLDAILALADALTSDNRYVAEYGRKFGKPITIVPMVTQIEKFDALRGKITPAAGKVCIGWVGSQGTAGALVKLQGVLQRLAERHANLELRVLGAQADSLAKVDGLPTRALATYSEDEMIAEVLRMDIGIHPIAIDLEDYIMRGGMKAFLYMSAGVASVCQKAGECADVIQDGVTGMLASNDEEWFEKLDALICSAELRQKMGEQARAAVRKEHTLEYVAARLEEALYPMSEQILSTPRPLEATVATPPAEDKRRRILLIADVPNWIFERHCLALQRYLADEFRFNIAYQNQAFNEDDYDLIYALEWNLVPPEWIKTPVKYVTGIRSHISWANVDFKQFIQYLSVYYQGVHVVSRRLEQIFKPHLPGVVYVTHGVDTQFFSPSSNAAQSGQRIRIGWVGNRKSPMKGFEQFIQPLGELPGVELMYFGYSDKMLSMEQMRDFYNAIDVYVCSSSLEGSNNPLLEAAAMERAIISTDNGTVPEYLKHGESAWIVERDLAQFTQAVDARRDDPAKRAALGMAARAAVVSGFDWRAKAEDFRLFFRNAITRAQGRQVVSMVAPPPARETEQINALLQQADQAFMRGEIKNSQSLLRQALDLAPDDIQLILAYGNLLLRSGDAEAARREFVKATVLAPDSSAALLNLAAVLILLKRYEDAEKVVQRILGRDPNNTDALKLMGNVLGELGQARDSALAYLSVLELKPDDMETWLVMGKRYFELGDWVSAQAAYKHALQIDPFQPVVREALRKIGEATRPPAEDAAQKGKPVVAFAILTHNALEFTKKALASIARYTPVPYEVFIVDNASTDETAAWLAQQNDAHVHYELSAENLGVSGGRNRLIQIILPRVSDDTYLVFMDNDIELFGGWIDPYLALCRSHSDVGIAGVAGYWMEVSREGRELRGPATRQPEAVDVASGGFATWIRAGVIREMGFFDENLGKFWHEDDDFSVRAQVLGYRVYALPRAAVVHHAHKSGTTSVEVAQRGSAQNQQYLVHKWRALGFLDAQGRVQIGAARRMDHPNANAKLKIVIDGFIFQWQAGQPLGISRVWRSVIAELAAALPEAEITLLRRRGYPVGIPGINEYEIPAMQMGTAEVLERDDAMLARVCAELGADVFMSTYYTRAPGVRNVLLMYDMIPEIFGWDLAHPEWLSKRRAIANASEYLAISHSTKRDLVRIYGVAEDRVTTAHIGVADVFKPATQVEVEAFLRKYDIRRPYFLLVGKREGYKNPLPFYQAFMALKETGMQVVAVGGAAQLSAEERRVMEAGQISVLPTIADEEMRAAYSGALALVYPSVYEGFGLPVAEAMACGCPVITARNSSLPEVGGEAVLYVDPRSGEEIGAALREVLKPTVRAHLRVRGIEQAQQFTWKKMAAVMAAVIRRQPVPQQAVVTEASDKPAHFPHRKTDYLVSVIVSTYKSAEFIGECLSDLVNQSIGERLEIIVVDAASPQNEGEIVAEFQKKHKNILYIRTGERIGVYAAWNLAIQNASGKYITPLSTNDRLRRDAHEIMLRALEEHPEAALVYGDTYITTTPHETFEKHTRAGAMLWGEYFYEDLLENNRVGPHPMWRKSIHEEVGYFDESFVAIGDQEFWLRIAERHPLLHLPVFTGLYWKTPASLSENLNNAIPEADAARRPYRQRYSGKKYSAWVRARKELGRAVEFIEQRKISEARAVLQGARETAPDYAPVLFGLARLLAFEGEHAQAVECLQRGVALEPMDWNARLLLADEFIAVKQVEQAAAVLEKMLEVMPNFAPALERKARLAAHIRQPVTVEEVKPTPSAAETLTALLEAEDLQAALQEHEAEFNQPLLDLIAENVSAAGADRQGELVEGLEALAAYIRDKIKERYTTQPEGKQASAWLVDVVVPIYGQSALVEACVESVLATTENAGLILVDDCSPGKEIETLFVRWKGNQRIKLYRNFTNLGFLDSCITGAALGNAPFVLFLNSDTQALENGWLEKLIPEEEDVAIAGAKLLYPPDAPGVSAGRVQHAGVARSEQGFPYHPFLSWAADTPQVNQKRYVNAVTGACFLIRRKVWDELGGWDRRFGRGVYEDVDLCWQARKKGYRVLYQPQAVLYHRSSASENVGGRHLLYNRKNQNLDALLAKWQPIGSDEEIFFGAQTVKRWQQARAVVLYASKLMEQGKSQDAFQIMKTAVKKNPDLPDVLIGFAQILAGQGKHAEAAEHLSRALEFSPEYWDARLLLVDELLAAEKPQEAGHELAYLMEVFPHEATVEERARRLAAYLPQQAPTLRGTAQVSRIQPVRPKAADTLTALLEAEDLPAALQTHVERLDEELLALVKQNAATAALAGETELVEGLKTLGEYIAAVIAERDKNVTKEQSVGDVILLQRAEAKDWQVDVVIPIYGSAQLLRECIEGLQKTSQNTHWILVDDCSPGEDVAEVFNGLRGRENITLARTRQNLGFIGTTRAGAGLGSAEFVLLLNSDTQASEPGWLEKLIPHERDVAVVGAKLVYPPQAARLVANKIQHAGVGVRKEPDVTRIYHPFQGQDMNYAEANKMRYVNAVSGACFLVRRAVWNELGGWDTRFGRGVFEDVDFCWRARQRGYRIQYQPAAWLYHHESASKGVDGIHSLHRCSAENLDKLLAKWHPVKADDEVFYGQKKTRCFSNAVEELKKAIDLAETGRLQRAVPMVKRVMSQCPDYTLALYWYADMLAAMGRCSEAVQQLTILAEREPLYWRGRARLVCELIDAGELDKAREQLELLREFSAEDEDVKSCTKKLAEVEKKISLAGQAAASYSARQTLEMLLQAEEIEAALRQHEARLDDDLHALVMQDAARARQEGEGELADGLDDLAAYVANVIAARKAAL